MQIDWFSYVAQIVNFLVLVALLRWLLYGPIVRAMQQREENIAQRLDAADERQAAADRQAEEYAQKSSEIDRQSQQVLEEARAQADEQRRQLLSEAREDANRQRDQWQATLDREREDLVADLQRQAAQLGLHMASQTLRELADAELEQRMCQALTSRLSQLQEDHRDKITEQLRNGDTPVTIRSRFDMPESCRDQLRQALEQTFGHHDRIAYETSSNVLCGLELEIGGYTFDWNVREFLKDTERRLHDVLTT